jgi:hypothetical protein
MNIVRVKHRLAGAAGSPGAVGQSGELALNFTTATPELWGSNGTSWVQLNPSSAYATSAQVIAGTATGIAIDPAGLAGASAVVSAGVADQGKLVKLDGNGLVDDTVVPKATGATITTGTATDTFITPATLAAAGSATGGLASANKYVRFDANGLLDTSFFDYATSAELLANAGTGTVNGLVNDNVLAASSTVVSAGAGDAGKFVKLDATGKIDASVLNLDVMEFKGGLNVTAAAPAAPNKGDTYIVTTGGTIAASFTGLGGGTATAGDQFIWDGAAWVRVVGATDLTAYVPLAGTAGVAGAAMTSGSVLTMNPAATGNVVLNGATGANFGALDKFIIDCGTF